MDDSADFSSLEAALEAAESYGQRRLEDVLTTKTEIEEVVTREEVEIQFAQLIKDPNLSLSGIEEDLRMLTPEDFLILALEDKFAISVLANRYTKDIAHYFLRYSLDVSHRTRTVTVSTEIDYATKAWF